MFLFNNLNLSQDEIKSYLHDFEEFCQGNKTMSPDAFKDLNIKLSINAVLNVGKHKFKNDSEGRRLIWTGTDNRNHDLGLIDNINVVRDYPGFHKLRSLSLGHDKVINHKTVEIPKLRRQVTYVELEDGSMGIGPNYKTALRNASLRMNLQGQFNWFSLVNLGKYFHGRA